MSIEVRQTTVDVRIEGNEGRVLAEPPEDGEENRQVLRLHYSLMGETQPTLAPLLLDFSQDDRGSAFRYDWQVGVTPSKPPGAGTGCGTCAKSAPWPCNC